MNQMGWDERELQRPIVKTVPITVAAQSEAWNIFARSKAGIVGSNTTQSIDVCFCGYSVFVLSCV
jgi:hypothetical protein